MTSRHYTNERQRREERIKLIGYTKIVKTVETDRGHKNGSELLCITDTGLILVYNARTHKLITKLIARPNQLRRYWAEVPKEIIEIAEYHKKMGWNKL